MARRDMKIKSIADREIAFTACRYKYFPEYQYATDIDHIEYTFVADQPTPIALFDLTRLDACPLDEEEYHRRLLERYYDKSTKAMVITAFADLLGCNAYILVYRNPYCLDWLSMENDYEQIEALTLGLTFKDVPYYYLYNLSANPQPELAGFERLSGEGFTSWLGSLRSGYLLKKSTAEGLERLKAGQ